MVLALCSRDHTFAARQGFQYNTGISQYFHVFSLYRAAELAFDVCELFLVYLTIRSVVGTIFKHAQIFQAIIETSGKYC